MMHPANREADRLRVIIESLAFTDPDMRMADAAPVILEIEQKTLQLESAQLPVNQIELPDLEPETVARFVDLQPDIQAEIPHRKIHAIKMLRQRVGGLGLKESKEGIEHWQNSRTGTKTPVTPITGTVTPAVIAAMIDGNPTLVTYLYDVHAASLSGPHPPGTPNKIVAIKEVRAAFAVGLKEAKEGTEEWLRTRPYMSPASV